MNIARKLTHAHFLHCDVCSQQQVGHNLNLLLRYIVDFPLAFEIDG